MYKNSLLFLAIFFGQIPAFCQNKTSQNLPTIIIDTIPSKLNMDAIYNRPFITNSKAPMGIGGYIEANSQYGATDGVATGLDLQMRRMTLFFSSTVANRIKFLSEIEFENGTKEISIETAVMDMEILPLVNFRAGILLNPIGAFNQNHDGPRWDFIDRPIVATEIIPSTLSSTGFGLHGKYFYKQYTLGYEAYITNGFDDGIILNQNNRTSFLAGKENPDKFFKNNSGLPMTNGKIAIRHRKLGELGISGMSGVYNQWQVDGTIIDKKRRASILALDFNTAIFNNKINITGECVKAFIQVPNGYIQNYGRSQWGFYTDAIASVWQGKIALWPKAKLSAGIRYDYTDYNTNTLQNTTEKIYDHTWAFTPCVSLRPTGTTVLRLNYKRQNTIDFFGNPPARTGLLLFGVSTYF